VYSTVNRTSTMLAKSNGFAARGTSSSHVVSTPLALTVR
jgi:hypothetical protein